MCNTMERRNEILLRVDRKVLPTKTWSASIRHATLFAAEDEAKEAIVTYGIANATGTERIERWCVVKDSKQIP
jgi:hypothetical protein